MKPKDKPTTIFFLRHGQPDNPKKLIKGVAPFPLTKLGRKQARIQGEKLKEEKIAAIFTSPVLRCQQTAKTVAGILKIRSKTKLTTYLTEWVSSLDGRPHSETDKLSLEDYNRAFEPREKVLKRMKYFLKMILAKYPGQKVVAVSHQGPIDLLLFSLQEKDISRTPGKDLITQFAEMIKLVLDDKMKIVDLERFLPNALVP